MSEIRVNNIIDEAGTGAPTLPNGVTIQGNTTGTNLTLSGDATVTGNLTVNGTTTTIDTAVTAVDSLDVDGDVSIGSSTTEIFANGRATFGDQITIGTIGSSAGTYGAVLGPAGSNRARLFFYSSTTGEPVISIASAPDASTTKTVKATISNNGSASFVSVSDSIGPLRRLGINGHNAATYTLVAGDAGKLVREATNGANITIPQNVFTAGDMISIFNVSGGDNTITSGSGITLYNTADGATGNRTLAAKGVCTIVCTDTNANEFIISGSGLS